MELGTFLYNKDICNVSSNYGSLWSNSCLFSAVECADAESEASPG